MRTEKSIVLDQKRTVKRIVVDVIMKDPKSGHASPTHAANLPGLVLGCIEVDVCKCVAHIQFAVCRYL